MNTLNIAHFSDNSTLNSAFNSPEPVILYRGTHTRPKHAGKTLRLAEDGTLQTVSSYGGGATFKARELLAATAEEFFAAIQSATPSEFWVAGELTTAGRALLQTHGKVRRNKQQSAKTYIVRGGVDPACLGEFARRGHVLDIDGVINDELRLLGVDVFNAPQEAAQLVASRYLPEWVKAGPLLWHLSSTSGVKGAHSARLHFYVWLDTPLRLAELKSILADDNEARGFDLFDLAPYNAAQPIYTANPLIHDDYDMPVADPIKHRWGIIPGTLDASPAPVVPALCSPRQRQHVQRPKAFKRTDGETQEFAAARKAQQYPVTSAACEALIGDGEGRRGLHSPINAAIMRRALELAREDRLDALDDYLTDHLHSVIMAAPTTRVEDRAQRGSIEELRRSANGAALSARTIVARERAEQAQRAMLPPLFADTEVESSEAQRRLDSFMDRFKRNVAAYRQTFITAANLASPVKNGARLTLADFKVNTAAAAQVWVAAHEVGLGKTRRLAALLAGLNLAAERFVVAVPTHRVAEQLQEMLAGLGVTDALVVRGIDHVASDGTLICAADEQIKEFAKRAKSKAASQRETACVVCPLRSQCAYLKQERRVAAPGIKIVTHAHLAGEIPGINAQYKPLMRVVPIIGTVIDERFDGALRVKQSGVFGEGRGSKAERLIASIANKFFVRGEVPTDDHWITKLSEAHDEARKVWAQARTTARKALKQTVGAFELPETELLERQRARVVMEFSRLILDQRASGATTLRGITAEPGAYNSVRITLDYRTLLPLWCREAPLLVLDATADPALLECLYAERHLSFGMVERAPKAAPILGPTPPPEYDAVTIEGAVRPPMLPINYERVRARKPHMRITACLDAPTGVARLTGAHEGKDVLPDEVKRRPHKLDGRVAVPTATGFDVYPARFRSDSANERVALAVRHFTEGAATAGVFTHKAVRHFWEAHGMLGRNVMPGHHGIGTALNDWQHVDRLAIVGAPRLSPDDLAAELDAFFAIDPRGRRPGMQCRQLPVGLRVTGGGTHGAERWSYEDGLTEAFARQLREAAIEQEIGRVRGVWRTADKPADVLLLLDGAPALDLTLDRVLPWSAFDALTPWDVGAAAGIVTESPTLMRHLFPGLLSSIDAGKRAKTELRQKGAEPLIDILPYRASAPNWRKPHSDTLQPHLIRLEKPNRHLSTHAVHLAPTRADALAQRLADALGRPLKDVTALPHDAPLVAPRAQPESAAAVASPDAQLAPDNATTAGTVPGDGIDAEIDALGLFKVGALSNDAQAERAIAQIELGRALGLHRHFEQVAAMGVPQADIVVWKTCG